MHQIKALHDEGNGYSKRQIAEELEISINTVSKYLDMTEEEINKRLQEPSRTKALDSYKDYIVHQLQKHPKLSATKIKRRLIAKGLGQSISDRTFRRYVRDLKNILLVKQERYYEPVIDMVPGVQCQVDIGEIRNVLIGGVPTTVYFAVFVLSYSRLMYVALSVKPG